MIWQCLSCITVEGVTNGFCPRCGPCQTNPMDGEAMLSIGALVLPDLQNEGVVIIPDPYN